MNIRSYEKNDYAACIAVFESNVGIFFDPGERRLLERFLMNELLTKEFFVIGEDPVVGCGGFLMAEDQHVELTWGMVHCKHHRKGFGSLLLDFRLNRIRELFGPVVVRIETSQHTQSFFERFGFEVRSVKRDGFGSGIDNVLMTLHETS